MWERQYEHGRWNGHQLNILATAIDGGQRLHVSAPLRLAAQHPCDG
ncbi:DNA circularization N-terminal domain-containing protein [Vibrio fluvialis]|nr:DNA circularization N-terminal domain-containing protein [Vibrio fluvialis]MBY7900179.1 DNA circularization N-terminal domain-containing protein [Vibrio fluvialis]MBY7938950.1 DNA circularization N-terminal domain-containing protein [Vibrio fluvialis]MBY8060224.1 DNA circularization N-terminal domain-containing protein [Vibrio fluvialis]MBY8256009.1 DNA circularization N-terminal domain-containing protein [Vibrio fluvialis]